MSNKISKVGVIGAGDGNEFLFPDRRSKELLSVAVRDHGIGRSVEYQDRDRPAVEDFRIGEAVGRQGKRQHDLDRRSKSRRQN